MASADWINVELDTLNPDDRQRYDEYKRVYKIAKAARLAFEAGMNTHYRSEDLLTDDQELKFGYNFGKLSIALGERRERKASAEARPKVTLVQWLETQANR